MTWDQWFRDSAFRRAVEKHANEPINHALIATLSEKKLRHFQDGVLLQTYPVSSSRRPPSNIEGSLGTPVGLHRIVEKYGDGAPAGTVFIGRQSQGHTFRERSDAGACQKALVTTRILRLAGLEPEVNLGLGVDSYNRYIYIHGTNIPDAPKRNVSAGCLLLTDPELIELYEAVPIGALVWIEL